jgi:type VI secretion system protein ImpK
MNPRFAAAVDPIIEYVLDILERIGRNEVVDAAEERERLRNRFRAAEAEVGEKPGWALAKYALVAWIDDMLIEAPWDGRNWWENNSLEFAYFKTRDRATQFFLKAKESAEMSQRDALEVFYLCVVLGFRGLYGLSESSFLAEQLQLPTDVESWAKRTSQSIQLGQGRPRLSGTARPGVGAPPLEGKFQLVGTSLVTVVLATFTIVVAFFSLYEQVTTWMKP